MEEGIDSNAGEAGAEHAVDAAAVVTKGAACFEGQSVLSRMNYGAENGSLLASVPDLVGKP